MFPQKVIEIFVLSVKLLESYSTFAQHIETSRNSASQNTFWASKKTHYHKNLKFRFLFLYYITLCLLHMRHTHAHTYILHMRWENKKKRVNQRVSSTSEHDEKYRKSSKSILWLIYPIDPCARRFLARVPKILVVLRNQ